MVFKDILVGRSIFMFDRTKIEVVEGKVAKRSDPEARLIGGVTEMVIDIDIDRQDGTPPQTYTFKDNAEVGYIGSVMISPSQEAVLREVEMIEHNAESQLAKREHYEQAIEKCKKIKGEISPSLREQMKSEERFTRIENSLAAMTESLKMLIEEHKKR